MLVAKGSLKASPSITQSPKSQNASIPQSPNDHLFEKRDAENPIFNSLIKTNE